MPAHGSEPYRGEAWCEHIDSGWSSSYLLVTTNAATPSAAEMAAPGDESVWESSPGGTVTVQVWGFQGGGVAPPNKYEVHIASPGGADVGATVASGAFAAVAGVILLATLTVDMDSNPLGAGASARAGTVELLAKLICDNSATNNWTLDSRGTVTGNPPALTRQSWARGYVRAPNTLSAHSVSNIGIGGTEPSLFASPDPLHTRITLGARWYRAAAVELELLASDNSTVEREQTLAAAAGPDYDYSWTGQAGLNRRVGNGMELSAALKDLRVKLPVQDFGGDNEFAFATAGHQAGWTRDSEVQITRADRLSADPRLTISVQAEKDSTRTDGGNDPGPYTISADQLFAWARVRNARVENQAGITMMQTLKSETTVINTHSTEITAADGWTPAGVNWTAFVAAPAGNRTQEAAPNAPADMIGLGLGAQNLSFSSAYTANRQVAIQVDDEAGPGTTRTVIVEYIDSDGTRLALDAAPSARIYRTDPITGAIVTELALTTATRIGATESWKVTWPVSATASGNHVVECRGVFSGGGVQGATPVTVRPRVVFDPTGLFA